MKSELRCIRPSQARSIPEPSRSKGFNGAGVLEIADDFHGDTYRAVYTVRFKDALYVLHAFQNKSKSGSEGDQR
jgi:phage-related protein